MRVELVGGPLDGLTVAPHAEPFVFIQGGGRVFLEPGPTRLLYRLAGDVYIFAGHTHGRCDDCGAYSEAARCLMCDRELARA